MYYETLGATIEAAAARLVADDAILEPFSGTPVLIIEADFGPINYGHTVQRDYPIALLKGRRTKKYFHVNIYRSNSGRYELTTYIL